MTWVEHVKNLKIIVLIINKIIQLKNNMDLLIILKNNIIGNKTKSFLAIFLISLISRSIIAYYYGDRVLENEWGTLVRNLHSFGSFSILRFGELFVPNLWMPPIYGYFVYLHSLFFGLNESLVISVLVSQIILSSLTSLFFYNITTYFFKKYLAFSGAVIFSLFPLIVFSASQISSVTIYLFILMIFFDLFLKFIDSQSCKLAIFIAVVSGILILTRRDFILIYIFSIFFLYIFFKIKLKKIILIILFTVITISPYLTRNYLAFNKIIMHSGFGYNVLKAYNPKAKVEGYDINGKFTEKVAEVEKNIYYRINEDKIYLVEAKKYILKEPGKYFNLFLNRIISFYFIDLDSSQKNYYNFFHIIPNLTISIFSFFGLIVFNKKNLKYNYLILTMFLIIFVYSCFALLPRYKVYILPFQIFLFLNFMEYLIKKLSIKN